MMYNKYYQINREIYFIINLFRDINVANTFYKFSQTLKSFDLHGTKKRFLFWNGGVDFQV